MRHRRRTGGTLARFAGGAAVTCALVLPAPAGLGAEPVWSPSATRPHCAVRYEPATHLMLMRCVGTERAATEVQSARLRTYLQDQQVKATGDHPIPLPDPPPSQSIPGYTV